jgi:hypothetical protein
MANVFEKKLEEQNPSQAPTLGMGSGTFGQQAQQRTNIAQGGSGRFTNLQQYIKANESNPNAQLLQREGTRRQEELGTRQQEFTKQAEPIKQQFEGIRSGQQFVQSALQDPTKIVQDPKNIERFSQYRTQGIGDVETPFQQLQSARGTLGTQQEQLASGLETIQRDPNALQNFIQSQRVNPALATRGENVLDRFLTQSTESGQRAIAGLGTTAGAIRGTQAPSIIQDVESLRTQAQGAPLTPGEVQNLLTGAVKPEEEFIRGINPEFIQERLGLNQRTVDPRFTNLEVAQYKRDTLKNYNQRLQDIQRNTSETNNEISRLSNAINTENSNINLANQIIRNSRSADEIKNAQITKNNAEINKTLYENQLRERNQVLRNIEFDKNNLRSTLSESDMNLLNTLNQYESQLGLNKQQLLEQYDPTRLSRIQALQQLTGSTPFTPLLQGRIS